MLDTTMDNNFTFVDTKKDSENLSTRLTKAMQRLSVSQSELARRLGTKPQTIQYLCCSGAKRSKFIFEISDALGINPAWLAAGEGRMLPDSKTDNVLTTVPLISWADILDWLSPQQPKKINGKHINVMPGFSKKCYALILDDTSMSPRIEKGAVLVVDPELTPKENDFVVAYGSFCQVPIVRRFVKQKEGYALIPINTELFKEIKLGKKDKILGVLCQTFYQFYGA